MPQVVVSSRLKVPADRFWSEQSIATVNYELGPWVRMSAPAKWQCVKLKDWDGQEQPFKSWILLLGLLPMDRHAFGTLELNQGMRFVETSSSWLNRVWRHERIVKSIAGGCEVVDQVHFEPRLSWLSAVVKPIYILVFRHRHARLQAQHAR